jgi:hypothetical protein
MTLDELRAQHEASKPLPQREQPYTGPFPRKRHSHRCAGCVRRGQLAAVACYKTQCASPQLTQSCAWCAPTRR